MCQLRRARESGLSFCRFCESCGYPLATADNNDSNGSGPYAGGFDVKTLPGTPIWMGDGEIIWRTYKAVQLRTRQHGEGTLFVTDSRVVFHARARGRGTQRPSMLVQQTKLESVTGLAAYVSRRISLTLFMFVLFGGFTSLISLVTFPPMGLLLGILTIAGAVALIGGAAKRGSTGVILHAGASDASPIGFGQFSEQRSRTGQPVRRQPQADRYLLADPLPGRPPGRRSRQRGRRLGPFRPRRGPVHRLTARRAAVLLYLRRIRFPRNPQWVNAPQ